MKYANLLILFLLLSRFAAAQGGGSLSGTVRDSTGKALKGANISLSGTRYTAITDSSGQFRLDAPPGRYQLRVSYVGYAPLVTAVRLPDQNLDLVLRGNTGMLSQVLVSTDQRGDRFCRDA